MLIPPWPSKAEHGEKIQYDDDFVYGPTSDFLPSFDSEAEWCTCDENGPCPFHAQYAYPPMEDLNT